MRDRGMYRGSAARWNGTALIWLAAFWAPVIGAWLHLLGQAPDHLAMDAALIYVAALAVGLAVLTAACVAAHALLILAVRWLAVRPDAWRRPVAAALCVAVGWLLAYEWTAWAMRLAHAFGAPQPLPDALAHAVGLGIALAYLLVGIGLAGTPLLPAVLPTRPVPTSAASRQPAPAASAPRLIAPSPYPLGRPGPNAPAFAPAPATAAIATAASASAATAPQQAVSLPLDTPLLLRYPARPTAPRGPAEPPAQTDVRDLPGEADEIETLAELAPYAGSTPLAAAPASEAEATAFAAVARVVPVTAPLPVVRPPHGAPEPRTVPVLPPADAALADDDRVRISTAIVLEVVTDDPPA